MMEIVQPFVLYASRRLLSATAALVAHLEQPKPVKATKKAHTKPAHPARAHIHDTPSLGERVADRMAAVVGSWGFVIGQTCFIGAWILLNHPGAGGAFDPFPWILLNLCMSTQAMYTGPVIMLSQNRQAAKDRLRDDTEAQEVEQLTSMNRTQLELLTAIHELTAQIRKQESTITTRQETAKHVR